MFLQFLNTDLNPYNLQISKEAILYDLNIVLSTVCLNPYLFYLAIRKTLLFRVIIKPQTYAKSFTKNTPNNTSINKISLILFNSSVCKQYCQYIL